MMLKRTASHFPCYWKALLRLHSTVSALKRQGNAMAVQSRALCGQFPLLGRLSSRDRLYETRLRGLHWVNISHIGNLWAGKAPASCWGQINRSIKTLAMQSGRISPGEQSVDAAFDPHVNSETWNVNTLEADGDGSATLRDDLGRLTRGSPFLRQDTQVQPEKLIVAVDIDEVLGSFLFALNTFIAERYFLNHRVSEYHVYDFNKIWKCSIAEANARVHEFFKSHHFIKGIHPIPGAYQALCQLSSFCHFSVVTSRQNVIKQHTIDWVERHYSGLFREIHFGNHFALDGVERSKSEICRSLGAQILIDDNPQYALECAENGIEVLLFDYHDSYPWCKTGDGPLHPLITKVHNWQEVEHHLGSSILS